MNILTAAAPLLFAATVLTAGVLAATQANAADTRLTDVGFINSARCAGLAQGLNQEAAAYDRAIDDLEYNRVDVSPFVYKRGEIDALYNEDFVNVRKS